MFLPALLEHTAQLVRMMMRSPQPAESLASEYFRSKKYIGGSDRRFLSAMSFGILRSLPLLETASARVSTASGIMLTEHLQSAEVLRPETRQAIHYYMCAVVLLCINDTIPVIPSADLPERLPLHSEVASSNAEAIQTVLQQVSGLPEADIRTWFAAMNDFCEGYKYLLQQTDDIDDIAKLTAMPTWIAERLAAEAGFSLNRLIDVGKSLLLPAPFTLRVNTRLASRLEVLEMLEALGISASKGALSPVAITVHQRIRIIETPLYQQGYVEIQDEASQLAAFAVAPERHWHILDACAGAGGKSLHLADLQDDSGSILACDTEIKRLQEIPYRAGRAGLSSITTHKIQRTSSDTFAKPLRPKHFHAVLVDAPCSGSGTFRRQPALKWKLQPKQIHKHAEQQLKILLHYADAVRPGGVLVYSTCSFLQEENERVVQRFLDTMPDFTTEPLLPIFQKFGILPSGLTASKHTFTAFSDMNGNPDGFFIARMRRLA